MGRRNQSAFLQSLPWDEPPPSLPKVTCRDRCFIVKGHDILPKCPYQLPHNRTLHGAYRWPFREFRSYTTPMLGTGYPGDIWLQLDENILFVCLLSGAWTEWRGFRGREEHCVKHPFARRYLAHSAGSFSWYPFQHIKTQNLKGQPLCAAEIVTSVLQSPLRKRKRGIGRKEEEALDSISFAATETDDGKSDDGYRQSALDSMDYVDPSSDSEEDPNTLHDRRQLKLNVLAPARKPRGTFIGVVLDAPQRRERSQPQVRQPEKIAADMVELNHRSHAIDEVYQLRDEVA